MGSEAKVRRMFQVPKEDSLFGEDELKNARGRLNEMSAAIQAQRSKRVAYEEELASIIGQ